MCKALESKIALVSGPTRGAGRGIAIELGASVMWICILLALLMLTSCTGIRRGTKQGGVPTSWPTSTPEKQGMDSATLVKLLEYVKKEAKGVDSLLVIRNGTIVLEVYYAPYTSDQKHILNSCTKSFLSALVGIAIDEGYIQGTSKQALDYFPEYPLPDKDQRREKITVENLLTMTSGIDWPQYGPNNINNKMTRSNGDWVRFILERPMAAEPGSQPNYSNGDAHLLSAIIQKATGETALDFGWEHLFQPLGISDVRWDYDPRGVSIGSAALYLTPRDMAKLGYLYLNEGKWQGRSIVSADWVRRSLQSHTKIPITGGSADYGYYWWIYPDRGLVEAWGGAGQRIGIFPDLGIVTVITANIPDDAPVTPFSSEVYRYIIEAAKPTEGLAENPEALAEAERHIAIAGEPRGAQQGLATMAGGFSLIVIAGIVVRHRRRKKIHADPPKATFIESS